MVKKILTKKCVFKTPIPQSPTEWIKSSS